MKKFFVLFLVFLLILSLTSCGVKPEDSRVVLTLDGEKIYYDYYKYIFLNTRDDLAYGQDDNYWENNYTGQLELTDSVMETLLRNKAITELAEEYDIRLTKDEKKYIDDYIKNSKEQLGGEDKFKESLAVSYLTEYSLRYVQKITIIWDNLYNYVTSEASGIIKCGDDIILADIPVNFRNIRYIMISNDENDDKSENLALSQKIRALAASGNDFKELISEYGEDDTMEEKLENGYYFTLGSIAEEIEDVVLELEENEISEVIDMGYAYYVIQRLPIDNEYVDDHFEDFRTSYCARIFNEMLDKKASEITVKYKTLYSELNVFNVK